MECRHTFMHWLRWAYATCAVVVAHLDVYKCTYIVACTINHLHITLSGFVQFIMLEGMLNFSVGFFSLSPSVYSYIAVNVGDDRIWLSHAILPHTHTHTYYLWIIHSLSFWSGIIWSYWICFFFYLSVCLIYLCFSRFIWNLDTFKYIYLNEIIFNWNASLWCMHTEPNIMDPSERLAYFIIRSPNVYKRRTFCYTTHTWIKYVDIANKVCTASRSRNVRVSSK